MGVELAGPVINECSLGLNLTNETGFGGSVRLLKNIAGLWLLQECRRAWALDGQEYDYAELARMAGAAQPFPSVIDPDAFLQPGGMPAQIGQWCRNHGQACPEEPAGMCRAILESLALRYRQVLESLESLLSRRLSVIHIVGGGARNEVLNQFVADATGRTVVAGPAEATAAGNIMVQAIGSGAVRDLAAARETIRRSFPLATYEPQPKADWDGAYEKFCSLRKS
jgi:rhamnulokinase